jgi:ubiquinone/menaquinone biosynthesis C-methylase UbiE
MTIKPTASPKILDYGCGTGGTTLNFSSLLDKPFTGLDIFETQLKIARTFADKQGLGCQFKLLEEGGRIPAETGSIDLIFSLDVLGHVPNIPHVLAEFSRALKSGGSVLLFTESTYSDADHSIMAKLAKDGADMMGAVPEHISLFSREKLEAMFKDAGFEILERYSANVWHFFFFPKDYVLLLKGNKNHRFVFGAAWVWNRISKILPFYPWPFQILRLFVTHLFGKNSYGTSYFYLLHKRGS